MIFYTITAFTKAYKPYLGTRMAHTLRSHYFHIVWSTKSRMDLLLPKVQEQLFPYMKTLAGNSKAYLHEIGGTANHIHSLVQISNLDNYSKLIRILKASTTVWLKRTFPECNQFNWQDGYGSFTVSVSNIDAVKRYIQNQEVHHSKQSFEDEYIQLLELNKIDFDPRFVFD
jgi:REP element-mobilizing transposase RayT